MLRTILFDLGNVLVHFSHEQMCRQIGELAGREPDDVRRQLFDSGLLRELECGRLTEDEFRDRLEAALRTRMPLPELRQAASDIFTLNAPLRPMLDDLKRRGLRLVLLSNTSRTHFDWVRANFDVMQPFDELVLSFEVGAVKPEEAIFRRALEAIRCRPEECLYTDDIAAYVERGREFGLRGEVFTTAERLWEKISTLSEGAPSESGRSGCGG